MKSQSQFNWYQKFICFEIIFHERIFFAELKEFCTLAIVLQNEIIENKVPTAYMDYG